MNVAELITLLGDYPQDASVLVSTHGGFFPLEVIYTLGPDMPEVVLEG